MRHIIKSTLIGALAGTLLSGATLADIGSSDPIKLTLHDWSGQLINTKIMGSILEEAGYNVEYVQADAFTVISDRDVPVEVDGEYVGRYEEVDFRPSERKLRVLAPEHAEEGFANVWKNWQDLPRKLAGDGKNTESREEPK